MNIQVGNYAPMNANLYKTFHPSMSFVPLLMNFNSYHYCRSCQSHNWEYQTAFMLVAETSINSRMMHIHCSFDWIDTKMSLSIWRLRSELNKMSSIYAIKEHSTRFVFHKLAFHWKPSARCIWVLTLERESAIEMP